MPSSTLPSRPAPSALQNLLQSHPIPPSSPHEPHLHHLALQIAHNLRYQHGWSEIRLHYHSTAAATNNGKTVSNSTGDVRAPLPRALISGRPPQRLYIHPDEQIALLQAQKAAGKKDGMPEVRAEREWVLPSHLREKWTLRRLASVFDGINVGEPAESEGEELFEDEDEEEREARAGEENEWRVRMPKRLLLATLDDDSTVVYYIVHDGVVKPRQN